MSLYSRFFYNSTIEDVFSEENTLRMMLEFEANLAQAQATCGLLSPEIAQTIRESCRLENLDIQRLKSDIVMSGNAAIPLVKQLIEMTRKLDEEAAKFVHFGATSQDVVDTATVLQINIFYDWFEKNIEILSNHLAKITDQHRHSMMMGRTLLQQATPITFGIKTAYWLEGILDCREHLNYTKKHVLQLQLSGAVGIGNARINKNVRQMLAKNLGLSERNSWHTNRISLQILADNLANLTLFLGKIAKDIILLMQTEVSEVYEGAADGKGGSSTMPHKRNPVTTTAILANASKISGLLASFKTSMLQEHERSAGLWHAEWDILTEIIKITAGSIEKSIDLFATLEVDTNKMRTNVEITNGLIFAERVSLALTPLLGKKKAHEFLESACREVIEQKRHLRDILKEAAFPIENIEELFNPAKSIGSCDEIIEAILDRYHKKL